MKKLYLTWSDLDAMKRVQVKLRTDYLATFSCNGSGKIWPFTRYGPTPESERIYLQEHFPKLREIVEMVLAERPIGGRVFVSKNGVSIEPKGKPRKEVIKFIFR